MDAWYLYLQTSSWDNGFTLDTMTARLELPTRTQQKLQSFRKRVWQVKLIEGACAALFGLVVTYICVFLLDRFIDTPAWLRLSLLFVGSLGLGVFFPLKCHRWIWQTRRLDQLARLLKHRMPRLSDRMLGIIELAHSDTEQHRSAALCAAALKQVDADIKDTTFDDAVPNPRHRAWGIALSIPAAVAISALLIVPAAGWSTVKRWLLPLGDTPRYTFAQLEPLPDELVVPYGEEFSVSARLTTDTFWTPKSAHAQVASQPAVEASLDENGYQFSLAPQQQDNRLAISVGDADKSIQVTPKRRPELKEITASIHLPDYLQYTAPIIQDVRAGTLSVVAGAEATLLASASRELRFATLNGQSEPVSADQIRTQPMLMDQSHTIELTWQDKYGLPPKQPFELKIEATEDQPPNVTCSELARQQVVLVDEVLAFEVSADDDFGVKQIGIEWQGLRDPLTNPRPAAGSALISAGSPESTSVAARATFCAARENIEPQTLQVRLYAVDYLPSRERVYSPPYTLFVLSQQDHANWLAERLKLWSRKAQGIYEREVQLHEENKALRQLDPQELEQTSTRQRIATQAAAENLNARQLQAITMNGKQLIQEAARNDQFNVATMEGLAQMVATLDDLAKNRMPSVADLLKTAATADSENAEESAPSDTNDENASAPKVGNNRDAGKSSGEEEQQDGGKDDKPAQQPGPAIVDVESSMDSDDESESQEKSDPQKAPPASPPKFGLPSTTVYGNMPPQPKAEQPPTMEQVLDLAIASQEELLEEFTKVAEELQRILDNLEGSTFVKRLKAASRRQTDVARQLNSGLSEKFAQSKSVLSASQQSSTLEIVEQERAEKNNVSTIKSDLEAYYQRVQESKFGTVIREMDELSVMAKLESLSELVEDNLHGQSIAHAEFWADTFDRWAEQLVGPG